MVAIESAKPGAVAATFTRQVIVSKLEQEICLLRETLAKIDPMSDDPGDQWAIPIYQKIIQRRQQLASSLNS